MIYREGQSIFVQREGSNEEEGLDTPLERLSLNVLYSHSQNNMIFEMQQPVDLEEQDARRALPRMSHPKTIRCDQHGGKKGSPP